MELLPTTHTHTHTHSQTQRRLLNQQPGAKLVLGGLALSHSVAWEESNYCDVHVINSPPNNRLMSDRSIPRSCRTRGHCCAAHRPDRGLCWGSVGSGPSSKLMFKAEVPYVCSNLFIKLGSSNVIELILANMLSSNVRK